MENAFNDWKGETNLKTDDPDWIYDKI